MRNQKNDIATYQLDPNFHGVHKAGAVESDFGLDNTAQLIEGGFGLYSSAGLKPKISPIKSEFFRLGFAKSGKVRLDCGLETYFMQGGDMIFTFPGQVFSMQDKSEDFFAYYLLFSEAFVADAISLKNLRDEPGTRIII